MAIRIVPSPAQEAAAKKILEHGLVLSSAPAEFFQLDAKYTIAPGASADALRNDFRCLFESGLGAFEDKTDKFDHAMWAGIYALRQAYAVFEELERVRRGEKGHG